MVDAWLVQKDVQMNSEVKLTQGNDHLNRLAEQPDIVIDVAAVRAEAAQANRAYAMGLALLRKAAELTQVELARRMGVSQDALSRMELPEDLLLSTLSSYLKAIGGSASVILRFADGREVSIELAGLS